MYRTFYNSNGVNLTSESGITSIPASPHEDARKNLVDLKKRLEEAETFLSASRRYLAASVTNLGIIKRYMCLSEADIHSASECVNKTEKKLRTMHSELQSVYQNIFCKNSSYCIQYDESERDANKIKEICAIRPLHMDDIMNSFADDMSIDLNDYLLKCYECRSTPFIILYPKNKQHGSKIDKERDTICDLRSSQRNIFENYATVRKDNRNCVSLENLGSFDKKYEETKPQYEVPHEKFPYLSIDPSINDLSLSKRLSETGRDDIFHLNDLDVLVGKYHVVPSCKADGEIPENSASNAASQSDMKFNGLYNSTENLLMKPKSREVGSSLNDCIAFGSTTQSNSVQNDSLRRFKRFPEIPESMKTDLKERLTREFGEKQNGDTRIRHSINHCLFDEKENKVSEEETENMKILECIKPQIEGAFPETYSSNFILTETRETEFKIIDKKPHRIKTERGEVDRNKHESHKKRFFDGKSKESKQTCKDRKENDQSWNSEGQSNQCAEISHPVDSVQTPSIVLKRTTSTDNLTHTFETDTVLKGDMKNKSVLGISVCTSSSEETNHLFLQHNQSTNELQTAQEPRSKNFQTKSNKTKFSSGKLIPVSFNPTKTAFQLEKEKSILSDREYNLDNISNRFSPGASLCNAVDNKNDYKILSFDTVPDNTTSLYSNIKTALSMNEPVSLTNISTATNNVLQPCISEQMPYSTNQRKTPRNNQPDKFREIGKIKNPSENKMVSRGTKQAMLCGNRNYYIVQGNSDSAFQKNLKATNRNCEPNESGTKLHESHFLCKKLSDSNDNKDGMFLVYECEGSCSTQNNSGIVGTGSGCIRTPSLLHEFDLDTKHEGLDCDSVSSEAARSEQSHNLSYCYMHKPYNDEFPKYSRLKLTERSSPSELDWSAERIFEDSYE